MTDNQIERDGEPEEVELYTIEVNGSPVVISASLQRRLGFSFCA